MTKTLMASSRKVRLRRMEDGDSMEDDTRIPVGNVAGEPAAMRPGKLLYDARVLPSIVR